jgi:HPr kinase/phosphorylase
MVEVNIHATCIAIGNQGILLTGKSGAGKSDLALRLIDRGAKLVADDRTILYVNQGALHARCPASIRGLLEIRGVGIVKFPSRANVKVTLVVKLGREGPRLPQQRAFRAPFEKTRPVPEIALNAFRPATPAKITAALAAFSRGLFRGTFITK